MKCSKRLSVTVLSLVVLLLVLRVSNGDAQHSSPRFGTWKLNVARSTISPESAPKLLIRTDEPAGDGVKVTYEGIEADGSRIAYSYTARYDGQEYRPTGVGMANGWETITVKRIDDYTFEATLKRAGQVVATTKNVVSKDGKTMTTTTNGTSVSFWERQ
jgi:hypothetical protein